MADQIIYNYEAMRQAVSNIEDIATRYQTAASTFLSDFNAAISSWEGASQVKMRALIEGSVNDHLSKEIPDLVNFYAELLSSDIQAMESTDNQVAESIPSTL